VGSRQSIVFLGYFAQTTHYAITTAAAQLQSFAFLSPTLLGTN